MKTKKFKIALTFICLSLFLISCSKSEGGSAGGTDKSKAKAEKKPDYVKSVLFYDEGSIRVENSKGEMEWVKTLTLGECFDTYPTVEGSTSEVTESKMSVSSGQSEQSEFTKVNYNDKDYWILSALIIPNSTPRLVTGENTVIYNDADISKVSSTTIPAGKIVAYLGEVTDDSDTTFAKISCRVGDRSYRNVYIRSENLSTYEDDVTCSRIIKKIAKVTNDTVKKELYDNISYLRISTYMKGEADLVKEELYPPVIEESTDDYSYDYDDSEDYDYDSDDESYDYEDSDSSETDSDYDDYYEFD